MRYTLLITLALFTAACGGNKPAPKPAYIISSDTMITVLAEMHVFNAAAQHREARRQLMQPRVHDDMMQFFDSIGVPKDHFEKSLDYYLNHPKDMLEVYDGAMDLLSARLAELRPGAVDSLAEAAKVPEKSIKELMEQDPNIVQQRIEAAKTETLKERAK